MSVIVACLGEREIDAELQSGASDFNLIGSRPMPHMYPPRCRPAPFPLYENVSPMTFVPLSCGTSNMD